MRLFSKPLYIAGIFFVFVILIGLFFVNEQKALALNGSDFNPAYIIDDIKFFNGGAMGVPEIQNFLNFKVPVCDTNHTRSSNPNDPGPPYTCLKDYVISYDSVEADSYCGAVVGGTKSAANIIYDVARACNVSPQVLLVLLQKEQSLVTDTWPWPIQYQKATGYGCPDTAGCNPEFSGFFKQVYYAARQFQRYVKQPNLFNHAAGRTSYILYNPNTDCGGTNITIQNSATAALYNYTPYQPNAAALANLYGTGDACSAYGNRNFWRLYNDWFGPSTGDGYVLVTSFNDNGDPRQWVVYNGIKRLVPDEATAIAWGLNNVSLLQWTGNYLGSVPTSSSLTRLMRPAGSLDVYFVDSGKCYKIVVPEMLNAWDFNPAAIIDVSVGLGRVPTNSGQLNYSIKNAADGTNIYLVDGGVARRYAGPDILTAWEGPGASYTTISSTYFSAMGTGTDITGTKITNGSQGAQEYQVVSKQKLPQPSVAMASLYPGVAQTVSQATIDRLVTSAPVSQFIRSGDSATIYLVDNLKKHTVSSPEVLRAWGVGPDPLVNIVTQGNLNLIPTDSTTPLNSYEADLGGQLYLMDGRKISVPNNLDSAYRTTGNIYSPTSSLMSLLPAGETASDFIKSFNAPMVYLMDAQSLRNISSPTDLVLWNNGKSITSVSDYVLSQFNTGSAIGSFVNDGTTEYLIQSGTKHSVSAAVKSNWQLPSSATINSATLNDNRFPTGAVLGNSLQNSGKYFRIHEKVAFSTTDPNIAEVWGVKNAPTMDATLVSRYLTTDMMTRFAKSKLSNDSRQFVVDNGVLYHLSPQQAVNLGLTSSQSLMAVNPEAITSSISVWSGIVVRDAANKAYVIDNGRKRWLPNGVIRNFWTNSDSITTLQMTNGFLNLLPTTANMERAIKGSGPNIYAGENITKRWIQSWNTYSTSYAPYALVSDSLINVLPDGSNIP